MHYHGNVFRPPSEAESLIIQVTYGCSHNKCTFCYMYKGEPFHIRPVDEVIESLSDIHPYYEKCRRIFLADGDALIMKQADLVRLLEYLQKRFPTCERVGIYASPRSILLKSPDELQRLKALGLGIMYLGVETGSDTILKNICKGVTRAQMIEAGKKVKEAGVLLSITMINGIGGKDLWEEHAVQTATISNEIQPDYIGLLNLRLYDTTELTRQTERGEFIPLKPRELLDETKLLLQNFNLKHTVFRSNHASNYISLAGILNQEKKRLLDQLEESYAFVDHIAKIKPILL
ncbi:MAG: radical SAM protein [Treponema sp.]